MLVTSVAAPAMAASANNPLSAVWTEAEYSGANGKWGFTFQLTNDGSVQINVTSIQVFTTYHAPATNATNAAVLTWNSNKNINGGASLTVSEGRDQFSPVPAKPGDTNLLPGYYNNSASTDAPKPICVKNTPVNFGDANYPYAADRLFADNTYVIITYTFILGGTQTRSLRLDFTQQIPILVPAGCS